MRTRLLLFGVAAVFLLSIAGYTLEAPIAHWKFDETEGETANDENGARHGTWVGNVGWVPEGGLYGGAIECNDDSSFIIVPDADAIFDDLGTEFTFSVWVQVYEFTQDWQGIIFKNDKFFLERNNSGSSGTVNGIHFKCKDETGAQPFNLYGDITIDDGAWHHIVGIYDSDMAYLYVDNVLDKEGEATGDFIGYVEDPLVIGAKFESTYRNSWLGLIDDVRIYNYSMTADQVDELYNLDVDSKISDTAGLGGEFVLQQNYPNPFNPKTTISYAVNTTGNVELNVYDLLGHQVATLVNGVQTAGNYQVTFDARDLSSGVYIYTLKSSESVLTNKMILMK